MTWDVAADTCQALWDDFVEAYNEEIAKKLEAAKNEFGDIHLTSVRGAVQVSDIEECKANFERIFPRFQESALRRLERDLLPKGKRVAHVGEVGSRHRIKGMFSRKKPVKHHRKKPGPKPKNPHARKHVKTGRARGWNNGSKVPLAHRAGKKWTKHESLTLARKRRQERGRVQRLIRRYRWSKSLGRFWRAYPRREHTR